MKSKYLWLVRKAFRTLRHRRLRSRPWWRRLTKPLFNRQLWKPCRDSVASGAATGAFFSMMPIPLQSFAAALVAMKLKGNVPFAVGISFLSNFFTNLPIWSAQLWLGNLIEERLAVPMPSVLTGMDATLPGIGPVNAGAFILGSIISGCVFAVGAFVFVHAFSGLLPRYLPARQPAGSKTQKQKPDFTPP